VTNLYDLMDQYQKVLDSEDDETLVAALEKIEEPIKDKVNNTVSLMKSVGSLIDAQKQEAKRIAGRAKVNENRLDKIKEYLMAVMTSHDVEQLETERFKITLVDAQAAYEVVDEARVPNEYRVMTLVMTRDEYSKLPGEAQETLVFMQKGDDKIDKAGMKAVGEVPEGMKLTRGKFVRVS
jgi:hypothetical protein